MKLLGRYSIQYVVTSTVADQELLIAPDPAFYKARSRCLNEVTAPGQTQEILTCLVNHLNKYTY